MKELRREIKNLKAGMELVEQRWNNFGTDYDAYDSDKAFYEESKKKLAIAKEELKHETHNYRIAMMRKVRA